MDKKISWKNIFPAINIPLNDDYSVNEKELRKYVSWLSKLEEIDGLVCNGPHGRNHFLQQGREKEDNGDCSR